MSAPLPVDGPGTRPPAGPAELPAPAFVTRLLDLVQGGVARGGAALASEWATSAGDSAPTWQEALERACRASGARLREIPLSCRAACAPEQTFAPRVTWRRDGGWLALAERRGDATRAITSDGAERWLEAGALARLLGLDDADAEVDWMLVERGLSAAASPPSGKLPPFRRLVELIRPERSDLFTIVLYAVVVGLLTLATPIAVQQLVNTVAFGGLVQPVVVLALLLFGGLSFAAVLSAFQAFLAEIIQRRVFVRAAVDLADRLPRVRHDAFGDAHGPEVVNRFFDLVTIQKTGATLLLGGTSVVLQTVAGLLILSFYHPLMLAFSVLLVGGIAFVVWVLGRGAVTSAIGESTAKYALAEWMEELARHPGTFRNRASRRYALGRADALAAGWADARRRHFRVVLRQIVGSLGLQVVASTFVLGLGGFLVVSGQMTLGQLVASEIIVTAVVAAVARLGKQLESFYDLLAAVEKIGVLIDLPLERERGRAPAPSPRPARVEVREVSVTPRHAAVLRDVSIEIESGERLGLTGPCASGKSTLVDVIAGVRVPEAGYVSIDGEDIRNLRLDALRDHVMSVRDPEVFSGTIADNLRVGRPGGSSADLERALERVGLLDEVRALPDGLDTAIATDGGPLSRSQVVRLMLARAVLAGPRLLALDEALVHLDPETRTVALDAVFDPEAPWTLVVVSHRDDVLDRCDRVFDLATGTVRTEGDGATARAPRIGGDDAGERGPA